MREMDDVMIGTVEVMCVVCVETSLQKEAPTWSIRQV